MQVALTELKMLPAFSLQQIIEPTGYRCSKFSKHFVPVA